MCRAATRRCSPDGDAALALLQAYANFGPPPTSAQGMAVMALALYVVLALLAAWVERATTRA